MICHIKNQSKSDIKDESFSLEMANDDYKEFEDSELKVVIDFTRGKASLSQMEEEDGLEGETF